MSNEKSVEISWVAYNDLLEQQAELIAAKQYFFDDAGQPLQEGQTTLEIIQSLHSEKETEISILQTQLNLVEKERDIYKEALEFYADPESYFAVAILGDRPCGEFADDSEELTGDFGHPDGSNWFKPGKKARIALFAAIGRDWEKEIKEAIIHNAKLDEERLKGND